MNLRQKASEKPVTVVLSGLLLLGLGSAAVTTVVSETVTADVSVEEGMRFEVTDTTGTLDDSQSFSVNTAQGSQFSFDIVKENRANDKTQDLVEVVVLDSDSGDVAAETLERVNFQATQQATQGDGSTVPQGTTVDYTVSVAQDGTIDESQNGDYLFVGNADTDSDSDSEAVICVANPGGGLGQGMTFGPNETWEADYTVDTQSTFTDGTVDVNSYLAAAVNPETGSTSQQAQYCPQY